MDSLSSVTPQGVSAEKMSQTRRDFSMAVTSRAMDQMQAEGQMLVQLIDQAGGLGRNLNTVA